MYYSWYMGLCGFLRLLHHQYTFFSSEKPKEIAQCIFNEQIATKKKFFLNILSEGAVNTLFSKKLFFCHLFHGLGFKRLSSCLSSVVCVWISAVWCLFLLRTRRVFSFLSTPVSTATIPSTFTKPKRDASNYICGDSVLVLNHTSFMNLYLCKWHQTRL